MVLRMQPVLVLFLSLCCAMEASAKQTLTYHNVRLTWKDAQDFCRKRHMDLVTVRDEKDNEYIAKDSWLGLHRESSGSSGSFESSGSSSPWKWSRGDEFISFQYPWADDDPDDGDDCVIKMTNKKGKWDSKVCDESYKFYCADEKLLLVTEKKTWEEALVHCRGLSSGGQQYDLASLLTPEDHEEVKNQITGQVWTGLRFLGDRWLWVGGEDVQYRGLTNCPENKRCGIVDKGKEQDYSIISCEEKRDFFCYKKPTKSAIEN